MTHLSRRSWLLVGGALVLLVCLVAFLAIRWALDPHLLKSLAETRLTAALGQPVAIGAVRLSFFPTPAVRGTDVVIGSAAAAAGPSVSIGAIRLHPRLSSIFRRPIVIDRVDIEDLVLNARRDAAGHWLLPLPRSTSGNASDASAGAAFEVAEVRLKNGRLTITDDRPIGRFISRTVAPLQNMDATVHRTGGVTRLDSLTASVGHSKVSGTGTVGADGLRLSLQWTDLKAADLPLIFALVGSGAPEGLAVEGRSPLALDLRVDQNGAVSASGKVAADRAALDTLTLTSFQAPIAFAKNRLSLDPTKFRAYSGSGTGRLGVNVASTPASWSLDERLDHVDINQFVSANTTAKDKVSGTATLDAHLRGTSRAPVERGVTGTVNVDVANGVIRNFPLVAAVYSALQLGNTNDHDLHFQTLSGTFVLADARASTSNLIARSGEMTMTAEGTIGFDQSIGMKGNVVFSSAKSAQFVHSVHELTAITNGNGEMEVPFTVSGSLAAPHFSIDVANILRRGLQQQLKQRIGDKLRDLFKKK